jgi:hypothetical protein
MDACVQSFLRSTYLFAFPYCYRLGSLETSSVWIERARVRVARLVFNNSNISDQEHADARGAQKVPITNMAVSRLIQARFTVFPCPRREY